MSDPTTATEPLLRHQALVVHSRYWLVPAADQEGTAPTPAPLLIGCHGYAETALDVLAQLRRIPGSERWHLVGVEAPHPFYKGRTPEVVRSWMTREDREVSIADNAAYLSQVIAAVRRELPTAAPMVLAGFSQGAAMAWRAALRGGWPCHGVIALGGDIPPDAVAPPPIAWPRILLGRGHEDPWYTADKLAADRATLEGLGARHEVCEYPAGHVWHEDFHQACGRLLAELAAS
jgi:predicted esterase